MDFKHNFLKVDILKIFDPPLMPKFTSATFFLRLPLCPKKI